MELDKIQKEILISMFEDDFTNWRGIAEKLVENGTCIVAGLTSPYVGGMGNFLKTKKEDEYVDCVRLTFDIEEFLGSAYFQDFRFAYLKNKHHLRDELNKEIESLEQL